jgi:cyclophilin family peptidyl-prolyl cis-trans isomerase
MDKSLRRRMGKQSWRMIAVAAGLALMTACGAGQAGNAGQASPPAGQNESQTAPADNNGATASKMSWSTPPKMEIDTKKSYQAIVKTSKGQFTIDLYAKDAPITVNNFVFLSKQKFYNNVTFHRIMKTFMIQTGDPLGNGTGGPGYKFQDEKTPYQYAPGIVAMANSGPNTNGSQFFICTGDDSKGLNMQPNYTIFGKVSAGMDVVQKIADTPVQMSNNGRPEMSQPKEKVTIDSIEIVEK